MDSLAQAVLLIDDDEDTLVCLRDALDAAGFAALTAQTGRDGLRALEEHRPALAMIDYELGDMTAHALLAEKACRAGLAQVPVIVMTGYRNVPLPDGAVDILQKPFSVDELIAAVSRYVAPLRAPGPSTSDLAESSATDRRILHDR